MLKEKKCKNVKYRNKLFCGLWVIMLCVLLSGCGMKLNVFNGMKKIYSKATSTARGWFSSSENRGEDHLDREMNAFIKALDAHDKGALRKCFSSYVQKNDKELDQEIDELFAAYPGPTDSWKWSMDSTQSYSSASDEAREYVTHTAILKSHGKNYYIYIEYTEGEYAGKDRYGICCVDFTTPEVQAAYCDGRFELTSYGGEYSWKGQDRYKLHVTVDHKDTYVTRRIDNQERIYVESETTYAADDFVEFIKKNHSLDDLRTRFGRENSIQKILQKVYYKVSDGEDLYVRIFIDGNEGNEITGIDLVNEDNYVKTLYVKPE